MNVEADNQYEEGFDCGWYGMTLGAQRDVVTNPGKYNGPPMSDRINPEGTGLWKMDNTTRHWPPERRSMAVHQEPWYPKERIRPEDLGSGASGAWQRERALDGQDFGEPAMTQTALRACAERVKDSKERGRQQERSRIETTHALEVARQVDHIMLAGIGALASAWTQESASSASGSKQCVLVAA
jgi:hypothetical protein